jgi:hypothetical protein
MGIRLRVVAEPMTLGNSEVKGDFITSNIPILLSFFYFFFAVLGFELRVYTLSHSTSPF